LRNVVLRRGTGWRLGVAGCDASQVLAGFNRKMLLGDLHLRAFRARAALIEL